MGERPRFASPSAGYVVQGRPVLERLSDADRTLLDRTLYDHRVVGLDDSWNEALSVDQCGYGCAVYTTIGYYDHLASIVAGFLKTRGLIKETEHG